MDLPFAQYKYIEISQYTKIFIENSQYFMEDFFDRLDKFMKAKGLNDNKLTIAANLSVGSLGKQRKTKGGLSTESIGKILDAFPDLNAGWLLTGKGKMLTMATPIIVEDPPLEYSKEELIQHLKKTVSDKDKEIASLNQEIGKLQALLNANNIRYK